MLVKKKQKKTLIVCLDGHCNSQNVVCGFAHQKKTNNLSISLVFQYKHLKAT